MKHLKVQCHWYGLANILILLMYSCPSDAQSFLKESNKNKANLFLDKLGIERNSFDVYKILNGKSLVSKLENWRDIFLLARRLSLSKAFDNINNLYKSNRESGRMQDIVPSTVQFPCDLKFSRSINPPTSVHRLRPGDIDIVASFGDSLSAGNGVISETIADVLNEFRGISFTGGGVGDWRIFLSLPNILKVFNPNIYGYATGDGLAADRTSRLNIAEPMIMSRDLPFQVRILIERMRFDPNVDIQRHWKLLTIFVGNNDVCSDMCHYKDIDEFLQRHEDDLHEAFTILRHNVPRLLINLVPSPNMITSLRQMRNVPLTCSLIHRFGCHCIFKSNMSPGELEQAKINIIRWQNIEEYVASLSKFQGDDFAIVYQPFTANLSVPSFLNGDTDLRFFSSDCFHFSQLGNAVMANSLWNNMMQPIGQKQLDITPLFSNFECPTKQRPYISTSQNS